jgi:7-cyano-7-deazaguanine reductase
MGIRAFDLAPPAAVPYDRSPDPDLMFFDRRLMSNTAENTVTTEAAVTAEKTVMYGERTIAEGKLITFPNPRPGRRFDINISLPEFTCKCPFSGYPDFATIEIHYVPNERVVELKAIKLYINSYRDRYISHEESINQILDDLVAACDPIAMTIKGDFQPRGNVHTVITVKHERDAGH